MRRSGLDLIIALHTTSYYNRVFGYFARGTTLFLRFGVGGKLGPPPKIFRCFPRFIFHLPLFCRERFLLSLYWRSGKAIVPGNNFYEVEKMGGKISLLSPSALRTFLAATRSHHNMKAYHNNMVVSTFLAVIHDTKQHQRNPTLDHGPHLSTL